MVVEDPRRSFNGVRGGFGGLWSRSVDRRRARRMISWRNVQQSTARIARTFDNMAICRTFMRSVFIITIMRGDGYIARRRG
jgi:hypothetical protein